MPAQHSVTVPLVAAHGGAIGAVHIPLQISFPVETPEEPGVANVDVSPVVADATWCFDAEHDDCAGDREIPVFAGAVGDDSEVGTLTCCGACMP